jgi:hypothetical protein
LPGGPLSLGCGPGGRVLMIRLSSDDLVVAFLGGVFLLIAGVWRKAKLIADEHAQIV